MYAAAIPKEQTKEKTHQTNIWIEKLLTSASSEARNEFAALVSCGYIFTLQSANAIAERERGENSNYLN